MSIKNKMWSRNMKILRGLTVFQHISNTYQLVTLALYLYICGIVTNCLLVNFKLFNLVTIATIVSIIAIIIFLIGIFITGTNYYMRYLYFLGVALCVGFISSLLLYAVIFENIKLITITMLMVSVLFFQFTFLPVFYRVTEELIQKLILDYMIYGNITFIIMLMLLFVFKMVTSLETVILFFGLEIFCIYVACDTFLMYYRIYNGDINYISHAMNLFFDFNRL